MINNPKFRVKLSGNKGAARDILPRAFNMVNDHISLNKRSSDNKISKFSKILDDGTTIIATTVHGYTSMEVSSPVISIDTRDLSSKKSHVKINESKSSKVDDSIARYIKVVLHADLPINLDFDQSSTDFPEVKSIIGIGIIDIKTKKLKKFKSFKTDVITTANYINSPDIKSLSDIVSSKKEMMEWYNNSFPFSFYDYDEGTSVNVNPIFPKSNGVEGWYSDWNDDGRLINGLMMNRSPAFGNLEPFPANEADPCSSKLSDLVGDDGTPYPMCHYVYHEEQCDVNNKVLQTWYFGDTGVFRGRDGSMFCAHVSHKDYKPNAGNIVDPFKGRRRTGTYFSPLGEIWNGLVQWDDDNQDIYMFDAYVSGYTLKGGRFNIARDEMPSPNTNWYVDGVGVYIDGIYGRYITHPYNSDTVYDHTKLASMFNLLGVITNDTYNTEAHGYDVNFTIAIADVFVKTIRAAGMPAFRVSSGEDLPDELPPIPPEISQDQVVGIWPDYEGVDASSMPGFVWCYPIMTATISSMLIHEIASKNNIIRNDGLDVEYQSGYEEI